MTYTLQTSALHRFMAFAALVAGLLSCQGERSTTRAASSASRDGGASAARREDGSLRRVRAAGVLRWGGDVQGGAPYVYEDPDHAGRNKGFEVDLANALARELGVRAEFVQNDWSALVPSLERGTFDIILNGLEVTRPRVGRVRFSRPYYVFAARLMARRDNPRVRADINALRGLRIGTLTNSFSEEILKDHAEIVGYEGTEEPYADCVAGRNDAVLLDDIIANIYGVPKPELRVVGDLQDGFYSIASRPADGDLSDALDAALDAALARIIERGELEQILRRENIYNDRQLGLRTWGETEQQRMLGQGPATPGSAGPPGASVSSTAPHRMSFGQVVLFVKGAGVTLLLSILAMMLAIPLGLGLAVARLYGPAPLARLAGAYVEFYLCLSGSDLKRRAPWAARTVRATIHAGTMMRRVVANVSASRTPRAAFTVTPSTIDVACHAPFAAPEGKGCARASTERASSSSETSARAGCCACARSLLRREHE